MPGAGPVQRDSFFTPKGGDAIVSGSAGEPVLSSYRLKRLFHRNKTKEVYSGVFQVSVVPPEKTAVLGISLSLRYAICRRLIVIAKP